MAFVLVPVRDSAGTAIAVFAFRIDPARVSEVVNPGRLGGPGETYAVDAEGRLVSTTRFAARVASLDILPAEANGVATAALMVRDPGVELEPGKPPATPPNTWPLTWSAAEVVAGRSGVNVDGYRNYLGNTVVGTWRWLPKWGIGLVNEIDRGEAYATLRVVRRAFAILAAALLLGALALAISSRQIYGLQKDVARAQRLGQYTLEDKIGEGGMGPSTGPATPSCAGPPPSSSSAPRSRARTPWPASSARCSSRARSRTPTPSPCTTTGAPKTASSITRWSTCRGSRSTASSRTTAPSPRHASFTS